MDEQLADQQGRGDSGGVPKSHWSRFSMKALMLLFVLVAVAIVAFQAGYGLGRTKLVLELIDEGWLPPKR